MEIGEVRVAEDADFKKLKTMCDEHSGWKVEINKQNTMVWTKTNDVSNFKMVKVRTIYEDVEATTLYDVLHDPAYRKTWDHTMLEGYEICVINPFNDIGYYAIRCPTPMRNRDFVTQRSWLDTGTEYYIFNHSVNHEKCPPRKGFIRGMSYFTGYMIRTLDNSRCQLTYISQSDPKGKLPAWAVNKITHMLAPKVVNRIYKACKKYLDWKSRNNPHFKPWLNAEQMMCNLPRFDPASIQPISSGMSRESLEEDEDMTEADIRDEDF